MDLDRHWQHYGHYFYIKNRINKSDIIIHSAYYKTSAVRNLRVF